jgi:purine-binding chemotaxis protein CheW
VGTETVDGKQSLKRRFVMNTMAAQEKAGGKEEAVLEVDQYVTFMIASENYAVPVLKVQEIIGMTEIVHVPNSLDFVEGVINLRGSVVPVVDMRKRFRMEVREYDKFTVIIIIEVKDMLLGMIVDSVSDVVDIEKTGIQNTPHFAAKIDTDFIKGIGQVNDKLAIILDMERIFSEEEIRKMDQEGAA